MSYSQSGEDKIIAKYFGDFKGSLLDIGANNGVTFINSRLLIENGWRAKLIEPSLAYSKLADLYDGHPHVTTHNFALSDKHGMLVFYEVQDSLLSTLNEEHAKLWGRPYTERIVPVFTAQGYDNYDFITLDAEGQDWNILQQIDLTNVKCLCVEYGKDEVLITRYCEKFNMKLLHRNGENLIFVK